VTPDDPFLCQNLPVGACEGIIVIGHSPDFIIGGDDFSNIDSNSRTSRDIDVPEITQAPVPITIPIQTNTDNSQCIIKESTVCKLDCAFLGGLASLISAEDITGLTRSGIPLTVEACKASCPSGNECFDMGVFSAFMLERMTD